MKGNFETIASPEQPSGAISPVREKYVINNVYSNTTTIAREKYLPPHPRYYCNWFE